MKIQTDASYLSRAWQGHHGGPGEMDLLAKISSTSECVAPFNTTTQILAAPNNHAWERESSALLMPKTSLPVCITQLHIARTEF